MKKGIMTACCGLFVYAAFTMGCMDRKPAPVCPVPTEVNQTDFQASGFDGVDLLVVVDNSVSMTEEQEIVQRNPGQAGGGRDLMVDHAVEFILGVVGSLVAQAVVTGAG